MDKKVAILLAGILIVVGLVGLEVYALGGGFLDKSKLVNALPAEEIPYILKIYDRSHYCKEYELKDGSIIINKYYTTAGLSNPGKWIYWDEVKVVLASNVRIIER